MGELVKRKVWIQGDSFAVTLPKWWCQLKGIDVNTELDVSLNKNQALVLDGLKQQEVE